MMAMGLLIGGDGQVGRPQTAPDDGPIHVHHRSHTSMGTRADHARGHNQSMGMVASKGRSPMVVGLRRDEVSDRASEVIKAMAQANISQRTRVRAPR